MNYVVTSPYFLFQSSYFCIASRGTLHLTRFSESRKSVSCIGRTWLGSITCTCSGVRSTIGKRALKLKFLLFLHHNEFWFKNNHWPLIGPRAASLAKAVISLPEYPSVNLKSKWFSNSCPRFSRYSTSNTLIYIRYTYCPKYTISFSVKGLLWRSSSFLNMSNRVSKTGIVMYILLLNRLKGSFDRT